MPARTGTDADALALAVSRRVERFAARLTWPSSRIELSRDHGERANEQLFHLGLTAVSIVWLIASALGRREVLATAIVFLAALPLALLAAHQTSQTINCGSIFAVILWITIAVDDASLVVENVARHYGHRRWAEPPVHDGRGTGCRAQFAPLSGRSATPGTRGVSRDGRRSRPPATS